MATLAHGRPLITTRPVTPIPELIHGRNAYFVPPADGKANAAAIKLLAGYIGIAPSRITLLRGQSSRNKQFLVAAAANGL